jgi:hypothetical protein
MVGPFVQRQQRQQCQQQWQQRWKVQEEWRQLRRWATRLQCRGCEGKQVAELPSATAYGSKGDSLYCVDTSRQVLAEAGEACRVHTTSPKISRATGFEGWAIVLTHTPSRLRNPRHTNVTTCPVSSQPSFSCACALPPTLNSQRLARGNANGALTHASRLPKKMCREWTSENNEKPSTACGDRSSVCSSASGAARHAAAQPLQQPSICPREPLHHHPRLHLPPPRRRPAALVCRRVRRATPWVAPRGAHPLVGDRGARGVHAWGGPRPARHCSSCGWPAAASERRDPQRHGRHCDPAGRL